MKRFSVLLQADTGETAIVVERAKSKQEVIKIVSARTTWAVKKVIQF